MPPSAHTVRLHLICRAADADADAVNAALRADHPGEVEVVPLEDRPDLCVASGQWTRPQAAALRSTLRALPVRVVAGVLIGSVDDADAQVVDVDDPTPADEEKARRTMRRALAEWDADPDPAPGKSKKEP